MSLADGRTREDFAALGTFRGNAAGLYAVTRGRDWDIDLWDWIAAASPSPEIPPPDQIEAWVSAWVFCSRWAGTVRRRPAYSFHAERAGVGPLLEAVSSQIIELAQVWAWPAIDEIGGLDDERLETTFALFDAAAYLSGALARGVYVPMEGRENEQAWKLALKLELQARGQLPRVVSEVGDYDGSERIVLLATQLDTDEFGRAIPASRLKRIVDEWCELFEAAPTPIRYLDISSRAPKRLVAALQGQTQLRGLAIKWGDYDSIAPIAGMPHLWNLNLGGASALTDISSLRSAPSLRVLSLEDCRRLTDLSPLGDLANLEEFTLSPGAGSGALTVPSIGFVRGMTGLRRLLMGARVLDEDYSPLLERADLDELRVRKQRVMHPPLNELAAAIPGLRTS